MNTVTYEWARRQVIICIAALADTSYQTRVWVQHQLPFDGYYDELNLQIHVLFDDYCILPDPASAIGDVLLPSDSIPRLTELGSLLDTMIERLGNAPDGDYLADPQWSQAVNLAQHCLPAMLLGGSWEHNEGDRDVYAEDRAEGRIPTVDLPATRRRVIKAVAALADEDYQRRTWTGDSDDPVTGSLHACLHTLIYDTHVLPDPAGAIGRVLLAGDEIDRLATLWTTLEPFRTDPPNAPWTSQDWQAVVTAALHCLPALVIAGAWIGPDPITLVTDQNGPDEGDRD